MPGDFVAEQIADTACDLLDHALIDRWGRPHRLAAMTTLGRAADVGVVLMHGQVSRRHSVIARADDGSWTVADAGSSNGTFVNDRLVATPTPIAPGDRIRLGGIGFFFVKDDGALLDLDASSPTVPPDAPLRRLPLHTPPRVAAIATTPSASAPALTLDALVVAAGLTDLIESRRGFGYRLRCAA